MVYHCGALGRRRTDVNLMTETDAQGSPFWRFSLRFYRVPGVADACIALQDGCGVDVNLLLFLLWLACDGRQVANADARRVCSEVASWREEVVVPLRNLRRRLKGGVPPIEHNTGELFRTCVKAVELEAERLQQEALFSLVPKLATTLAASIEAAARANVAAYDAALGLSLPAATLEVLFAALSAVDTSTPRAETG
jgi:uncharacterized protein (TIGR02444 family)